MKVDVWSSEDGHPVRDGDFSYCAGLTSNALPESQSSVPAEVSRKGVSTKCTLLATRLKVQKEKNTPHWYALRTTYGREKKAYDFLTANGITAFYPTINVVKIVMVSAKMLPNPVCRTFSSPMVPKSKLNLLFTTT